MKNVRGTLQSFGFNRNSSVQQLIIGSVAGFATGYLTMKVGKKVAFLVGGGIILFQIAQNHGITKASWDDACVKAKTMTKNMGIKTSNLKSKAKTYACKNNSFAASFVGGFLIGASCK